MGVWIYEQLYTQLFIASYYSAVAHLRTPQITRAHAKPSQTSTCRLLVTAFSGGYYSAPVLTTSRALSSLFTDELPTHS